MNHNKSGMLSGLLILACGALASCLGPTLPSSADIGLSFSTQPTAIPADLVWAKIGQAHELINTKDLMVVVGAGANPISDADWLYFLPLAPWKKNIQRNLLFSESAFLHSPNAPAGATGDARFTYRDLFGHTWLELALPVSVDFIPAGEKTDVYKPAPGHLVVKTIKKAQILRFTGSIYQLSDNHGNFYVMHAIESDSPTLDVALPAGWTLKQVVLDADLVVAPSVDGYYNIVGDCQGQGYHQYIFAGPVWP